jgi:hypothetical protein
MARKLKIMENEKHPPEDLKNDEITGKRCPLDRQTLYAPVQGNTRAKKWEWLGKGVGDFWDSIGNVIEENT